MAYEYYELLARAQQWAINALAEEQITQQQADTLLAIDSRAADSLFAAEALTGERPLVVAFLGGTGVGKSSLLNRLAKGPIARVGIERPTSREVTLYHHESLSLQHLPPGLPLDSVKISRHADIDNRSIVWIDMPDFDSIERGNQHLVLEWLPHIDVLLYVVSPERYRDNKAWQLLLAEGGKHAWLFVMNQWDRGQAVQFDDFKKQLLKANFEDPLMFRTSCSEPDGDEFPELLDQLKQLSGRLSVVQLKQRSDHLRLQQLTQRLEALAQDLVSRDHGALIETYQNLWQRAELQFQQGLALPLQQIAKFWAEHPGQKHEITIWDDWAKNRCDDLLDELLLQAAQLGISRKALKAGRQGIRTHVEKKVNHTVESCGRLALLNPGNALQRFLLKFTAACEAVLPLMAMSIVGYQVFSGYYHSTTEHHAFLGLDFAIHSVLLIGISWAIPFYLHKKIQPSQRKAALKGLQKGLQQALLALDEEIKSLLAEEQSSHANLMQDLKILRVQCQPHEAVTIDKESLLGRVLQSE